MTNSRLSKEWMAAAMKAYPPRIEGNKLDTGLVRVAFPVLTQKALEKQKTQFPGQAPKWQLQLLYPSKDVRVIVEFLRAGVRQHYPAFASNPDALIDPFNKDHALRDQALRVNVSDHPEGKERIKKTLSGFEPGYYFSNPKSGVDYPIPCFRSMNGRWVSIPEAELTQQVYGGCWGKARLSIIKSGLQSKPGVYFGIDGFWKLADDTPFGGGGRATAEDGGAIDQSLLIEDQNAVMQSNPAPGDDWSGSSSSDSSSSPWD